MSGEAFRVLVRDTGLPPETLLRVGADQYLQSVAKIVTLNRTYVLKLAADERLLSQQRTVSALVKIS